MRHGVALKYLKLAPGGREILFEDQSARSAGRLCLWNLKTAVEQWFDTDPDTYGFSVRGSVSPDGHSIGTVLSAYDPADPYGETSSLAVVSLIDVASGAMRRIFATDGGAGGDGCGVAWSPHQDMVAATYVASPDAEHGEEMFTTVVLHTSGKVINRLVGDWGTTLSPVGNEAWLDDQTLRCLGDERLMSLDLVSGHFGPVGGFLNAIARTGDRLVKHLPWTGSPEPIRLATTALDGTDERAWLSFMAASEIEIDFA